MGLILQLFTLASAFMLGARSDFLSENGEVTLATLTAPLQPQLDALTEHLEKRVKEFEPELHELVHYTFSHSGKRLRPLLVFMCGYDGPRVQEDLVTAAAVVELVHLATLVHDDILDNADLRHKAPTLVRQHGAHVAVLLGDALFAEALRLAAEFPTPEVCRAVAHATRRVCAGEIAQTFQRGNDRIEIEDYMRVIGLKTADLFSVSCYLGGLLSNSPEGFPAAADKFGQHLGIAYQIFDDVADLLGDEERIGKTLGTDLASGKFTLPLIYLLEERSPADRDELVKCLRSGIEADELKRLLGAKGVVARVRQTFMEHINAAEAAIAPYQKLPAYAPLSALARFVRDQMNRFQA